MNVKFTFEMRIIHKKSLALMGYHTHLIQTADFLIYLIKIQMGILCYEAFWEEYFSWQKKSNRNCSIDSVSESQSHKELTVSVKLSRNLYSFIWLKSRQSLVKRLMYIWVMHIESRMLKNFYKPRKV